MGELVTHFLCNYFLFKLIKHGNLKGHLMRFDKRADKLMNCAGTICLISLSYSQLVIRLEAHVKMADPFTAKQLKKTFLVNTKHILSRELKTIAFSPVKILLFTRENSDVFNSLDELFFA